MGDTITLKERERDILRLMARGATNRMIAARLNLSEETVRWHNKQCFARLGVGTRQAAVARAVSLGLLGGADTPVAGDVVRRSPIRYVSNDGVSIAYQVIGNGPVDLLFMSGFVSHVELAWEAPECAEFLEGLGRAARLIVFDKRGVGLSDRHRGVGSIEETISDAHAVLRAVGADRVFVGGTSESGAAAILLASMFPSQVRGLVLVGTTPMPARQGDEPEWAVPTALFEKRVAMIQARWGEAWALERFAPSRLGDPAFEAWWSRALRSAASPASAALIMQQAMQVDVRALLRHVQVPTLILHRTDDAIVSVGAARYLATQLPNATLVEFPGADHLYFVDAAPLVREIVRFLETPDPGSQADTWVAVILHAHGAGAHLDAQKRSLLKACAAKHVTVTGDGWTALFDAPNRALRCAQSLAGLGAARAGGMALHVGAARLADGAPTGSAPQVARTVAASAAAGEILITATLRDILAGSPASLAARSIVSGGEDTAAMTVWQLLR